jgi:hypothetical protein
VQAELCQVGDYQVLTVGDRRIVLKPDAVVQHRSGWLGQRFTIAQPGEASFTHRYRLPWVSQLARCGRRPMTAGPQKQTTPDSN